MSGRPLSVQTVVTAMGPGGAERRLAELASDLAARGHRVGLAVLHGVEAFYDLDPRIRARFFEREVASADWRPWRVVARRRWLRRLLAGEDVDVVLSFIDVANVWTLACAPRGRPVVVSERIYPPRHPVPTYVAWLRGRLYRRAAAVVVQTEAAAAWARRLVAADRVRVIPNPVRALEVGASDLELPAGRLLLAIGRLDPQKGFDLLLEAFAGIADDHPDWTLVVLGEGPERSALERRRATLGLERRILLPGVVREVGGVLAAADLFVLSSRYEGFPNALCEAMAAGTAVVATDCPVGPAEIVRHGVDGVLVAPDDAGALGAALAALMRDEATRRRLGEAARHVAHRFAHRRVVDAWEALLHEV